MLTLDKVCKAILGQMGSKMGFSGVFGRVSREETTHFSRLPNNRVLAGQAGASEGEKNTRRGGLNCVFK